MTPGRMNHKLWITTVRFDMNVGLARCVVKQDAQDPPGQSLKVWLTFRRGVTEGSHRVVEG